MKKISNLDKINALLNKDKIATINIQGRMKYEKKWSILVDDTDNPNGIIFKNGYWNIIYSPNDTIAKNLINHLKEKELGFAGVLIKYYNMMKESNKIDWDEICHLYYIDPKEIKIPQIRHNVEKLRLEDAEIVNEFYTYKDEDSIEYIKECIIERETSCIFDEAGKPISWAVIREDGSMGIMYTRKDHRGKGLAISVTWDLIRKVINNGDIPYVHIVHGNEASVRLAKAIGFKKYGDIAWFGTKDN
ncbi:GNAT family N-acetyltransferase [Clostridium sp. D2Q-11]|uniref:GNAT family N-acetyltransferase n=1 Tax=Anaeromonas frigoriresistens TaxID=2683708 RepID=A0A942Z5Z8_9FIRM|nr:GNAT family N-acetyltransferase [Anaeromonas frigoriresistens]MBS4537966.1 GNAT family N-acetyltransferase [Anaeromonas frigoriresistens]